jgi:outer membrane protein OmpA-like peptidoglycan-associated protein
MRAHRSLLAAACAVALLAGCAGGSRLQPPEVVRLQNEYDRVARDTRIAPFAETELVAARNALDALVVDGRRMHDDEFDHNVYITDRLIKVAEAEGLATYAETRGQALASERETLLLDARTRQADHALAQADAERQAAERARTEAEIARSDAEMARTDAQIARLELETLRSRLTELEAVQTERGLVVTLGDVLFEVDRAELKPGATRSLDELVQVLRENPNATVAIEGHTDSTGGRDYNLSLSQRRSDSVRSYLLAQGIAAERISANGLGPDFPVASNNDAAGRQQNRRVELVIQDRPVVLTDAE